MAQQPDLTLQPQDNKQPTKVRDGEQPKLWYRNERTFCVDSAWYFQTREGVDVGPYKCQFDAELEASLLLQKLRQTPEAQIRQVIRNHVLDAHSDAGTLNNAAFTDYLVESGGIELLQREGG